MKNVKYEISAAALALAVMMTACGSESSDNIAEQTPAPYAAEKETVPGSETETQSENETQAQTEEDYYLEEFDYGDNNVPENTSGLTSPNSFAAKTAAGETYTADDFSGADVTMINIWSTTCPPCISEMPELAKLEKSLPDNVNLITWCLDGDFNSDALEKILGDSDYDGVTLVSGGGDLASLMGQLMYTPTTICVDSKGNIIGDELIGAPRDAESAYTEKINESLRAIGKEEI